jgi:hypothetical protein
MNKSGWVEVMGVVAVVVSLAFVAIEINQNTSATAAQAMLDLSDSINEVMLLQSEDAELSTIVMNGNEDLESLNKIERWRYERLMWSVLNAHESAYIFFQNGLIDEAQYSGWLDAGCRQLERPGTKAIWKQMQPFASDFDQHMESSCDL